MRRLVLRTQANAEIIEAFEWYRARSPQVAARFLDEVDAAMGRIVARPEASPLIRGTLRRAAVVRFPYAIYFRIFDEHISVVAVVHGRQRRRRWMRR